MHEMSIAEGIVDIALDIAKQHNAKVIKAIQLQLGKLSGVEPGALQFCFSSVTKNTLAEGATLEIEIVPIRGECLDCGKSFEVSDYTFKCPTCQSVLVHVQSGRELRVVSVDID